MLHRSVLLSSLFFIMLSPCFYSAFTDSSRHQPNNQHFETVPDQTSSNVFQRIDSLISAPSPTPFNGVILISQGSKIKYSRLFGKKDSIQKQPFQISDQFVVGSISKQFTAVLVLQEYDKGRLKVSTPIRAYLPDLQASWADSVTVHQLLTHTHGITALNKPLAFEPGTRYAYSQIGYDLLARITEKTSGKSFPQQAQQLFRALGMKHTFHPETKKYSHLLQGHTYKDGKITAEQKTFENYPAAGTFISTASDLVTWNTLLHNGELLQSETYKLMTTKQKNAIRDHPIFGIVEYGYGITIDDQEGIRQLGQTGFAPGFVSMDYYFPGTKTSVVVLINFVSNEDDLKEAFFYHTHILRILKKANALR